MQQFIFMSFTRYFTENDAAYGSSDHHSNASDWILNCAIVKWVCKFRELSAKSEINRPEESEADVKHKEVGILD